MSSRTGAPQKRSDGRGRKTLGAFLITRYEMCLGKNIPLQPEWLAAAPCFGQGRGGSIPTAAEGVSKGAYSSESPQTIKTTVDAFNSERSWVRIPPNGSVEAPCFRSLSGGMKPMLEYLKNEANMTYTENGAVSYASTNSDCLDLFATVGGMRNSETAELYKRFMRAYGEDPDTAMKILFYARDVRGGLGERRIFRELLVWLAKNHAESVRKNIELIPEYGRYDDLVELLGTPCEKDALALIRRQLEADRKALETEGAAVSLLGKWLPSVNASNTVTISRAKRIARKLGMTDAEYRKMLTALRARIRIVENNLREKDYTFDYEKLPSKAAFRYRTAFRRNDGERYAEFLDRVERGEAVLKTNSVMPYELIDPYLSDSNWTNLRRCFLRPIPAEEQRTLNATWASFADYAGKTNALAVIDTSGSMYWTRNPMPASVALSLGLYFAEHSKGAFRDHFMMFSEHPQLIELKGKAFCDKLKYAASFCEVGNTNIEAMFELVLNTAVKYNVKQEELPEQLVIISDMEFDGCVENASLTNFENAKRRYAAYGYKLPQIVFWNVASRHQQVPVRMNEQGVMLISGCTPRLFSMISGGADITPYALMMEIIGSPRYAAVAA